MKLDVKTVCELTKPLKVLYAEDDFELRMETEIFFKHFFSDITLADDGLEALKYYKEKTFDLIISDINMPNMDGIEMAKAIKKISENQPFIFISAHDDSSHLMELMAMGITKFIAKPFKSDQLLQVLYETAKEITSKKDEQHYYNSLEDENIQFLQEGSISPTKKDEVKQDKPPKDDKDAFQLKAENISIESSILKKKDTLQASDLNQKIDIDIDELDDIFDQMDSLVAMKCLHLDETFTLAERENLAALLSRYAAQLLSYQVFHAVSQKLVDLSHVIRDVDIPQDMSIQEYIFTIIESLLKTLKTWQSNLNNSSNLNFYDDSISNDIDTLIMTWEDKHDDIEGDIDFF